MRTEESNSSFFLYIRIKHSTKHSSTSVVSRAHCHWWRCCGRLFNYSQMWLSCRWDAL